MFPTGVANAAEEFWDIAEDTKYEVKQPDNKKQKTEK